VGLDDTLFSIAAKSSFLRAIFLASLNSRLSISILVYLVETSTIVISSFASDNVLLYKVLEYHLYEAKGTKSSSKSRWYICNSFFGFLVYRELGTSFDFCLGLFLPWWHFPRVLLFMFFLLICGQTGGRAGQLDVTCVIVVGQFLVD
jgi:hypothetical protein